MNWEYIGSGPLEMGDVYRSPCEGGYLYMVAEGWIHGDNSYKIPEIFSITFVPAVRVAPTVTTPWPPVESIPRPGRRKRARLDGDEVFDDE